MPTNTTNETNIDNSAEETVETLVCAECGDSLDADIDEFKTQDAKHYCTSCFDDLFVPCGRCETVVEVDDSTEVSVITYTTRRRRTAERWCGDCVDSHAFRCDDCREYFSNYCDRYGVNGNDDICQSCYENGDYSTCENCSNSFSTDSMYLRNEEWYCSDCDPGEDRDDDGDGDGDGYCDVIHSYTYKPYPSFFGHGVHYGVELEVSVKGGLAPVAKSIAEIVGDHAYLKQDGSISRGFEIVTHPHSLEEHRKLFTSLCEDWPEGVSSYAGGECGIHVHIERSKLSQLQIGKMLVFVNGDKNKNFIETIAQRQGSHWCEIKQKKVADVRRYPDSRYEALNLMNSKTVELRIFRGNTRLDRIMKAVEFADALVSFVKSHGIADMTVGAFIAHVGKDRKTWSNLFAFLVEKGYVPAPRVNPNSTGGRSGKTTNRSEDSN